MGNGGTSRIGDLEKRVGAEDGAGLGVGVIGEVLVDEEGDLDGSDGALAEILGLLGFRFRHF